jgi:protein SCO1/2
MSRASNRVATLAATLAGGALLLLATDGLRVFTAEGARRLDVARRPRPVPIALLEDSAGNEFSSSALRGRATLVGFVYTQCGTLCPRLSERFAELQEQIRARHRSEDVRLLSVSFDPERDTPERLDEYARHLAAEPGLWSFARMRDPRALREWLSVFGIVVIPDSRGGFEHNAALHVVDPGGRLIGVFDLDEIDAALQAAVDP